MNSLVVFSSLTGNTEKIARAIYDSMKFKKDIVSINEDFKLEQYDLIAIGYWVNKGTCDEKVEEIISSIHNKKIILFGTLGAKDSGNYYEKIKDRVEGLINKDNEIIGHFLCQGKINERLTERYKEILKKNSTDEHIIEQLKNHEEASKHPNNEDIENVKKLIKNINEEYCS